MRKRLRALVVEDSEDDAVLVVRELERGGYDVFSERVDTEEAMAAAFETTPWDLVLADYTLPRFDMFAALAVLKKRTLDTPFIIVSGTIGKTTAVQAMRTGAHDYLLKNDLTRLVPAVERELRAAGIRNSQREAHEQLRASEARFENLYQNAPDMFASVDPAMDKIVQCNRTLETATGYTRDEILGHSLFDLHHPDCLEDVEKALQSFRQTGEVRDAELQLKRKDGSKLDVSLHLSAVRDEQGTVYGRASWRDITDRKRAAEEIKQLEVQFRGAQRMEAIGRLAGGIAHDFNNVLAVIQGYAGFLQERFPDGDPAREDIECIQDAATRAASLTKQLLAFSRRQLQQLEVLDLNTVVHELLKMLRPLIGEDISLVTAVAKAPVYVTADRGQIDQILMNLAVNARDAMPAGGTLRIETAHVHLDEDYAQTHVGASPGDYVMLAMTDTGAGIDEETQARIFEPFFTTKARGVGTGLGLASVYGIVKQSGGSVWVSSEPGYGTTFKIYLPRAVEAEPVVVRPPRLAADTGGGTETILLVEDEERVRQVARRILEKHGYSVLEAEDGPAAVQICEQHDAPIDLVLTDVVMPGMGGRELTDRLRSLRSNFRALYMSGYATDTIAHRHVLQEGSTFVEKPFTADALLSKVCEALHGPTAQ